MLGNSFTDEERSTFLFHLAKLKLRYVAAFRCANTKEKKNKFRDLIRCVQRVEKEVKKDES